MNQKKFSIEEKHPAAETELLLKNNTTGEWVSLLCDSGARVSELQLSNGKELISVVRKITNADSTNRDDIFTNAKLSPFAGRIREGKYNFDSREYQMIKNYPEEENACHGFVYDKKFHLVEKRTSDDFASATLEYRTDGETQGYPFQFSVRLNYKLSKGGLECKTEIKNTSEMNMPLSDGWHFYFELGKSIDELEMQTEELTQKLLDGNMIPNRRSMPFHQFVEPKLLKGQNFDSCFHLAKVSRAETRLYNKQTGIDLTVWQESGEGKYQYMVIYTPPDRKSIAIEPMTSNVNAFNNKEGLITLEPQQIFTASFGIHLKKIF